MTDRSVRAVRLFVSLLVVGFCATAGVLWLRRGSAAPSDDPGSVFTRIQEAVLAGDGDAMWRAMDDHGREAFARFVVTALRPAPDSAAGKAYREFLDISRDDLQQLAPRDLLRRENDAMREVHYRGARVQEVLPEGPEDALLVVSLRGGLVRRWHVRRRDGQWWIHDLSPSIRPDGGLVPGGPGHRAPGR